MDRVVAPYYATNCWIIAPAKNSYCVVIDPGIAIPNLVKELKAKLEEHNLVVGAIFLPMAILITHFLSTLLLKTLLKVIPIFIKLIGTY